MSYAKAMKHSNNHRNDRFRQPILGMPFDDLKEGQHIESGFSIASRTATGYNVRVRDSRDEDFEQVSKEFNTEDDAVIFLRENDLDNKHLQVRIYSTEGMHVSGW